jgi:hypothetical protein
MSALLIVWLLGCTTPDEGACPSYADAPTAPDGSISDSCGWWSLAVGDHLYANVFLSEPEAPCSEALGDGLSLNADPIYSATADAPKWTYDIVADASGTGLGVDITCDDGTRWSALVDVE